ncbi:hypothetical protein TGS27_1445 [Geobacillus stearothermophilus]|uniref:Uncharacterized protein n=1 Tax=Geobacillus stearothermophilus TaxID=1422 RepID=A0ABQ7HIH0_GEOSE|nr:hypothetical protein GS8_262 [Geobacillus stearothermophilus]OAO82252.1 hypothetical protein TGS27_1445 [Geobacillus stearothermophilus]
MRIPLHGIALYSMERRTASHPKNLHLFFIEKDGFPIYN